MQNSFRPCLYVFPENIFASGDRKEKSAMQVYQLFLGGSLYRLTSLFMGRSDIYGQDEGFAVHIKKLLHFKLSNLCFGRNRDYGVSIVDGSSGNGVSG